MRTYIYTNRTDYTDRGTNIRITVFRVKNNVPRQVAEKCYHSGMWKGGLPSAHNLIAKADNLRMADGYRLLSKDVQVFEVA